jgi:phosphatidylinositol dimannoside acyltransferase
MSEPLPAGRGETWTQTVAYHAYRAIAWLGRTMPERRGQRLFAAVARLAHDLMPGVRRTVALNQAQVLGRRPGDPLVRSSTKEAFETYARYWYDTFHLNVLDDQLLGERFNAVDVDNLWTALEGGRGAICALPHMGNWDVAGRWLLTTGQRLVSVAEQLEPPRLYELFLDHRQGMGMDIISTADKGVGHQLSARLAENRVVALVADRDLSGRGIDVTMFGRTRKLPAGPALLSITTGAPLLVCPTYQHPAPEGTRWTCIFGEPLTIEASGDRRKDVTALTERMAAGFERAIAAAPSDWHMFQPGWPEMTPAVPGRR